MAKGKLLLISPDFQEKKGGTSFSNSLCIMQQPKAGVAGAAKMPAYMSILKNKMHCKRSPLAGSLPPPEADAVLGACRLHNVLLKAHAVSEMLCSQDEPGGRLRLCKLLPAKQRPQGKLGMKWHANGPDCDWLQAVPASSGLHCSALPVGSGLHCTACLQAAANTDKRLTEIQAVPAAAIGSKGTWTAYSKQAYPSAQGTKRRMDQAIAILRQGQTSRLCIMQSCRKVLLSCTHAHRVGCLHMLESPAEPCQPTSRAVPAHRHHHLPTDIACICQHRLHCLPTIIITCQPTLPAPASIACIARLPIPPELPTNRHHHLPTNTACTCRHRLPANNACHLTSLANQPTLPTTLPSGT
eukprot:1160322-Pelagomonas_calceolata.AAC.8